jgi:hypothetical protein
MRKTAQVSLVAIATGSIATLFLVLGTFGPRRPDAAIELDKQATTGGPRSNSEHSSNGAEKTLVLGGLTEGDESRQEAGGTAHDGKADDRGIILDRIGSVAVRAGQLFVDDHPFSTLDLSRLSAPLAKELDGRIRELQVAIAREIKKNKIFPKEQVLFDEQFYGSGAYLGEDQIYTAVKTDKPSEAPPYLPSFGMLPVHQESHPDAYLTRDARRRMLLESPLRREREAELAGVTDKLNSGEVVGRLETTADLQYIYVFADDGHIVYMSSHMLFP